MEFVRILGLEIAVNDPDKVGNRSSSIGFVHHSLFLVRLSVLLVLDS